MNPMMIPMLIQGGMGLAQLIGGAVKNKNTKLDPYTPVAENRAVNQAYSDAAKAKIPGQELIEDKIAGSTANAIENAKMVTSDPNKVLAAVSRANQGQNNALNNLAMTASNYQDRQRQRIDRALFNKGRSDERAFRYNKLMPYERDSATASALQGGGIQNIGGAMNNISALMYLDKQYGNQNPS